MRKKLRISGLIVSVMLASLLLLAGCIKEGSSECKPEENKEAQIDVDSDEWEDEVMQNENDSSGSLW